MHYVQRSFFFHDDVINFSRVKLLHISNVESSACVTPVPRTAISTLLEIEIKASQTHLYTELLTT